MHRYVNQADATLLRLPFPSKTGDAPVVWANMGTEMNCWEMPHDRLRKKRAWKRRKKDVGNSYVNHVLRKFGCSCKGDRSDELLFDKVIVDVGVSILIYHNSSCVSG